MLIHGPPVETRPPSLETPPGARMLMLTSVIWKPELAWHPNLPWAQNSASPDLVYYGLVFFEWSREIPCRGPTIPGVYRAFMWGICVLRLFQSTLLDGPSSSVFHGISDRKRSLWEVNSYKTPRKSRSFMRSLIADSWRWAAVSAPRRRVSAFLVFPPFIDDLTPPLSGALLALNTDKFSLNSFSMKLRFLSDIFLEAREYRCVCVCVFFMGTENEGYSAWRGRCEDPPAGAGFLCREAAVAVCRPRAGCYQASGRQPPATRQEERAYSFVRGRGYLPFTGAASG